MRGKLELNLKPSYMSFVCSASGVRRFRYCSKDRIRELLEDLGILEKRQALPTEYVVHLDGEFDESILEKYGLCRQVLSEYAGAESPLKLIREQEGDLQI